MGLGDIFQIVSLSRRSGTLQLTTPSQSGEIVFDQGRVVAAYMTGEADSVGDSLLSLGAVTPTAYQEMLGAQADGLAGRELLRKFEDEARGLSDGLDELLRRTIYEMFDWDEGTFSFVLEENPDPWRGFSLAGTRVVVVKGLNPQYLAIEGARLRDERNKDDALASFLARDSNKPPLQSSSAAEVKSMAAQLRESKVEEGEHLTPREEPAPEEPAVVGAPDAPDSVGEPAATPDLAAPSEVASVASVASAASGPDAAQPQTIETESVVSAAPPGWCLLAVDDDPQVTHHIEEAFGDRFAEVILANTVADAFGQMDGRDNLIVVSDLIIARSDGAGILGGIEILERIRERSSDLPVILFTDYENAEAQKKADNLGVAGFLMKPRKAQIQAVKQKGGLSPAMQEFLVGLGTALDPYMGEASSRPAPAASEPAATEPAATEPAATEPAATEPAATEPAATEPAATDLATTAAPTAVVEPPASPNPVAMVTPALAIQEVPAAPVVPAAPLAPAAPVAPAVQEVPAAPVAPAEPAPLAPAEPTALNPIVGADVLDDGHEHNKLVTEAIPYDLRREIAGYIQDVDVPGWDDLPPAAVSSEQVNTLRSMLAELVDPANRDTVTLLVLRFASVVFDRAVLFLVTRRFYVGLGGFSAEESSDQFVVRVRKIQVPVSAESVFSKVTRFRSPYRGPLAHSAGNERLIGGLGGSWPPGQVVAVPLISNDRVAAILYGDNPAGGEIGPTDTLEIFLQQAGLAMDRVLLERKLEEARRS